MRIVPVVAFPDIYHALQRRKGPVIVFDDRVYIFSAPLYVCNGNTPYISTVVVEIRSGPRNK